MRSQASTGTMTPASLVALTPWSLPAPASTGPLVLLAAALVVPVALDEAPPPPVAEEPEPEDVEPLPPPPPMEDTGEVAVVAESAELGNDPELAEVAVAVAEPEVLVVAVEGPDVVPEDTTVDAADGVLDVKDDEPEVDDTVPLEAVLVVPEPVGEAELVADAELEIDVEDTALEEDGAAVEDLLEVEDVVEITITDTEEPVCWAEVTSTSVEVTSAAGRLLLVVGEVASDSSQKSMYCMNWSSTYVRGVIAPEPPFTLMHLLQPA